jgi:acyl-CoA synthetase (AMP-forming)/AMP-acid ligase II
VISQLVDDAVREHADSSAVRWSDGAWTYAQLSAAANQIAAQRPNWRGQRIGISCRRTERQIALLVALDRIGAAAFLIPSSLTPAAVDGLRTQYGLAEIVGDELSNTLDATSVPSQPGEPGSVVLFTSGTSGPPKPAVHSWHSLSAAVSRRSQNMGRRWLLAYDLARFAGLQVMLQSLATAGALCLPASRDPQDVVRCLRDDRVEFASGTPTFWRMLLGAATSEELAGCTLAQITLGGEAVDQGVLDRLRGSVIFTPRRKWEPALSLTTAAPAFRRRSLKILRCRRA